jgi:AHBA synthesis associated protein
MDINHSDNNAPACPLPIIIFDLDGTLVHNDDAMIRAFATAYKRTVGDGAPPLAQLRYHLGKPFPIIIRELGLPKIFESAYVAATYEFAHLAYLYPGIRGALEALKALSLRLAVATGRDNTRARFILDRLDLLGFFDRVFGFDDVPRGKPAPDVVERILVECDGDRQASVMVGDSSADFCCARSAGLYAVGAGWNPCALHTDLLKADLVLEDPAELLRVIYDRGIKIHPSETVVHVR